MVLLIEVKYFVPSIFTALIAIFWFLFSSLKHEIPKYVCMTPVNTLLQGVFSAVNASILIFIMLFLIMSCINVLADEPQMAREPSW